MSSMTARGLRVAAFALGVTLLSGGVRADDGDNQRGHATLEGTWVAVVPSGSTQGTPFLSMQTHTSTGQAFEENNTAQLRSAAHGEWVRTAGHQFLRTLLFFNFQLSVGGVRTYAGVTRVQSEITLDKDGDSYTAVSRFEVFNTNGLLVNSGQNVAQARRCGFNASIPVCLGLTS
jgi:hypothetical protein